jgi:cyclase
MSSSHLDLPPLGPPRVEEVSDGVYAYVQPDGTWWINNTGFLVGGRGVTSIDACSTERRTRAYLDAIRSVTGQPVRTLVNTHHHGDHTYGNYLFGGATIVAHERCREDVIAGGLPDFGAVWDEVNWGSLELAPPFLTYRDRVTVWVDDLACEIMGSADGAIDVLETVVRPFAARTIVPGHGPVGGPELIENAVAYLRFVMDTARQGIAAGLDPLETARQADLGEFAGMSDPERIVGNLHRAFAELSGTPRGGVIDVRSALADMVTYNDGRPLSCRA